jgi:plasmid maintenance system antidote protein VapI
MEQEVHIGELIREKLKENRRSAAWLAQQLHCDRTNIYKLYRKNTIDASQLLLVSIAMNFDFFGYYSACVKKCSQTGDNL